jgi:hypothetical protein
MKFCSYFSFLSAVKSGIYLRKKCGCSQQSGGTQSTAFGPRKPQFYYFLKLCAFSVTSEPPVFKCVSFPSIWNHFTFPSVSLIQSHFVLMHSFFFYLNSFLMMLTSAVRQVLYPEALAKSRIIRCVQQINWKHINVCHFTRAYFKSMFANMKKWF